MRQRGCAYPRQIFLQQGVQHNPAPRDRRRVQAPPFAARLPEKQHMGIDGFLPKVRSPEAEGCTLHVPPVSSGSIDGSSPKARKVLYDSVVCDSHVRWINQGSFSNFASICILSAMKD
ncbi:hypothetical protein DUNSADRAFT_16330 [Dunaliella salina]|uniref:Encoded protein n=1 Tax=Dunaliella salina TaxID=3046 RepID=A0ABQ7G3R8_DUNSA|nr:hypothetical protein DUNSADRAFT_16330 [Dunaliella salina]|eukprot:KAF5829257.1 hypothetical protein DUNSADRAFT_16330 [Dunaliella salina]